MAKVSPDVGPKDPQIVTLFGATGDLARRKLLPGLFHLVSGGFIPGCRIIGLSLDDIDADAFRTLARGALDEFSTRKIEEAERSTRESARRGSPEGERPPIRESERRASR